MNTEEQKRFVRDLIDSVERNILADIDGGKVPAEWDGIELRQLLAERFGRSTANMDRKRKADYNNTVLINNL